MAIRSIFCLSLPNVASLFYEKETHAEFGRNGNASRLYLLVWTRNEMDKFCDEFEVHREKFSAMDIPYRESVVANFKVLGVP